MNLMGEYEPKAFSDILDEACAEVLGVNKEEYITKIEETTEYRAELIIGAALSGEDDKIEKAKRLFKLI